MHVYPEITSTISEFWQANKYINEVPEDQLTPMWADWKKNSYRHFYVKEIAQLWSGKHIIPLRWVVYKEEEHAQVLYLDEIRPGEYQLHDPDLCYIPCSELMSNFLDIRSIHPQLILHGK